jgi:hypothetical protein
MNYLKIYNAIVARAKNRKIEGYSETHHIVPRCMGGEDSPENLVDLTPEEHFICHLLLVKIYPENGKLIFALNKMCRARKGRTKRRMYGWLKRKFSEEMRKISSGDKNSQYGSVWITNGKETTKINKNDALPAGWTHGRKLKPENYQEKRPRMGRIGISNRLEPVEILNMYESGMSTKQIAEIVGWKSPKAVTVFLSDRFPERKRYAPREIRSISSERESTPLVSERSSVQTRYRAP